MSDADVRSITPRQVAAFLDELEESGFTPRNVNKYRQVLSVAYAYGCRLNFGFHLITTGWMQLELSMMGLFGRGGIAVGKFFADDTFLYGPALIDAWETESNKAIYPRVVLHESAAAFAIAELERFRGGETEVHRTHLAVDRDGLPFVNYLVSIYDEPADVQAMLDNHKNHIQSRLKQHHGDPRVHLKYEWLADYHDRFCRADFPARHRGDLMIGAVDGPELIQFGEEVLRKR